MTLKKLFLAHHSKYAREVLYLATELQLRGIVPWVDKDGGFEVADETEEVARRAIRHECFGLMLYANKGAFERPFIRDVELDEAKSTYTDAVAAGRAYDLFAVPRGISYGYLSRRSLEVMGIDLAGKHSARIPMGAGLAAKSSPESGRSGSTELEFTRRCEQLAGEVARRVLHRASKLQGTRSVSLQFRTRGEIMPDRDEDLLFIDAASLFKGGSPAEGDIARFLRALVDVRDHIAHYFGRPSLYVHGSKHLSTAFLFGRVFSRCHLDIRQTPEEVWSTEAPFSEAGSFEESIDVTGHAGGRLFVEVAVGYKNTADGVNAYIVDQGVLPAVRLRLQPPAVMMPLVVDNGLCIALVKQTYAAIERVVKDHGCSEIHLFISAHQSFMMMLGREFRGMPPVHLYEWDGSKYVRWFCVPADI